MEARPVPDDEQQPTPSESLLESLERSGASEEVLAAARKAVEELKKDEREAGVVTAA
jgi:hypothetical protein